MSSKRSAAALGLGAAAGAVAFYILSRDDDNKEALLDGLESLREGVADVTARVRKAAEAAVERVTAAADSGPPAQPAPAPSPPKASPLADHEAFDEEGDDEQEAPEEQDEDDALADAREAMASPDGDATPNTGGNPWPTVSPFRVTYPIGGGTTPTKPPEEDEEKALADAIDAAADDSLRGEGFIGSRELTAQLLQAADASRAPCRSPFAELGDGEGLPQQ